MTMPNLPAQGSTAWYAHYSALHNTTVSTRAGTEGVVAHDGTAGGGTRPAGFFRVRWVGGTTRPGNMAAGDIWEHDA